MKIQIIERSKLMRAEWKRELSDDTVEVITRIIEYTRINHGHDKAEAIAKEIRLLIETGISEAELAQRLEQMKEGRSRILIIRSLDKKDLQESTVKRVLSIITDTHKKYGEVAAETIATQLIDIVESSETEDELLKKLNQMT